ncbi:DUF222 domain-containing protein [Pedococcus sp. NPDC057267]|uniref:HNH endonuclease signature motif containing protein n=1 Tax=Pedococcus sp. NPDC057267 TaxID=3346077 RepID=UPI00364449AE
MSGGMALEQRREALELACAALDGIGEELWSAQGTELGPLLTLVDRVGARVGAGRVAVLAAAVERGEASGGTTGAQRWLRDHAPSLRAGGSAPVVTVVEHARLPRYALLKEAVLDARVPVMHAACVVDEYERIGHRLHPAAQGPVMEALVGIAEEGTRRDIRAVRRRLVARYGHDGEFQGEQDRLRERTSLSQPMDDGSGLYEYRLVADAEGRAVLEAAVQALSAPRPADGEPDRRPSGQRRFDALVEVVRRGVASADGVPTTPKAQLFVSMDLADLTARLGAGTVFGSGDVGQLLGPETVRRIACDAGVVPVVLGSSGEVVDLGRRHRFFSSAQVRALWLRDGHCSFTGCSVPASWCDAHHLWHWADGGPTDLDHAALLCGRHHTVVHAKGFHGTVGEGRVEWDVTPGAYDHWLSQRRPRSADMLSVSSSSAVDPRPAQAACASTRVFDERGQVSTAAPGPPPPQAWRP